ncbi:hypothetical protein SUGI_1225420 [Cryptomeria japonica]|uniref:Uncharacterized protein n=1 Tax=Cryptomeria japonica TaxID=3369 RepID=A0AAD3NPY4_CRYJA|nr:hypothetical protein SUGI_1225420 [Cryptomeria japonica]
MGEEMAAEAIETNVSVFAFASTSSVGSVSVSVPSTESATYSSRSKRNAIGREDWCETIILKDASAPVLKPLLLWDRLSPLSLLQQEKKLVLIYLDLELRELELSEVVVVKPLLDMDQVN